MKEQAEAGEEGYKMGFVERPGEKIALCRFFRVDKTTRAITLRNTANGEFAVTENIIHMEHAGTPYIKFGLAVVDVNNRRMKELGI